MIRIYRVDSEVDSHIFGDSVAEELFGTTIQRLSNGRPVLRGGAPHISISHTKGYWAIQSSQSQCGLDIELHTRRSEHIAQKFASHQEIELCSKVFPLNPTLLIWCAKEALFKWLIEDGIDFRKDLSIVGATPTTLRAVALKYEVELGWYLEGELLIVHIL